MCTSWSFKVGVKIPSGQNVVITNVMQTLGFHFLNSLIFKIGAKSISKSIDDHGCTHFSCGVSC